MNPSRMIVYVGLLALLLPATASSLKVQEVWPDDTPHQGFGEPYFGDLDGDGDLDIVLVHHGEGVYVWRNDGGDAWTEMTTEDFSSIGDPHGVAMGDYDGDGDLDIFVSRGAAGGGLVGQKYDRLLRNEGGFRFTEIAGEAGVENKDGRGRTPLWFDHDGDGDLDLLVLNLSTPHVLYRNDGGTFTDITQSANLAAVSDQLFIRHPVDLDGDGDMDLLFGGHVADAYFENRGGAFFDETAGVGLPFAGGTSCFAMADYDRDGDLDLFVARNWGDKKRQVYWDAGRIAFADKRGMQAPGLDIDASGSLRFVLYANSRPASGGIFLGEDKVRVGEHDFVLAPTHSDLQGEPSFRLDSDPAYYIWRAGGDWHIRWNEGKKNPYMYGEIHAQGGSIKNVRKVDIPEPEIPPYRDQLFRNDGGLFTDVTDEAGIPSRPEDRSPGAAWADFDEDGWPDLYIVRAGLRVAGDAPDVLLRNRGDGTFKDISRVVPTGKKGGKVGNGQGAGAADVNGDGRPDLFVKWGHAEPVPGMGPDRLFLNPVSGKRILVELRPTQSAPGAHGAKVAVQVGPHVQLREHWGFAGGTSFGQAAAAPLHFGLGKAAGADRITVEWPSGLVQTAEDVPAGTRVVFQEGGPVTTSPKGDPRLPPRPLMEGGLR